MKTQFAFKGTRSAFKGTQLAFKGSQLIFKGSRSAFKGTHSVFKETDSMSYRLFWALKIEFELHIAAICQQIKLERSVKKQKKEVEFFFRVLQSPFF